ncbi:hypothetical protein JCM10908_002309 [Rhodotorula pacifica]|uniref:protein kinase COQ8 n=1 Tax=Rhodotorula pacifica TaxID=1495444 RepID=UPI00317DF037
MASSGNTRAVKGALHLLKLSNIIRQARSIPNLLDHNAKRTTAAPHFDSFQPHTHAHTRQAELTPAPLAASHAPPSPAQVPQPVEPRRQGDDTVIDHSRPLVQPHSTIDDSIEPKQPPIPPTSTESVPPPSRNSTPASPPPTATAPDPSLLVPESPAPPPPLTPTAEPLPPPTTAPTPECEPAVKAPTPETVPIPDLPDPEFAASTTTTTTANASVSRVPSSRFGRLMHYGGLAASLGWGMASEAVFRRPDTHPSSSSTEEGTPRRSLLMSEANLERLVSKLGKMRGAALKLGQFMSIQDTKQLPPQLEAILQRVQNSANYMPEWQTESVLRDTLGEDWRTHFADFEMRPFAAASIGQVHRAKLCPNSPLAASYPHLTDLAVKVQFPGVRESITSDLGTLRWLLLASAALPRGLYLDNTLRVMGRELEDECDYVREAECGTRMREFVQRSRELKDAFDVPRVVKELSGGMVLTTELMKGRPLKDVLTLEQDKRDWIGKRILQLCMHELFEFRLMQTDPNWSNFLYNQSSGKLELIDFGATREYTPEFMDLYGRLLDAAIHKDREAAIRYSSELGYFTGQESEAMINAHLDSLFALATPFRPSSPSPFPFGTLGPPITAKIRAQIPIMLRERLTPPPEETYSLNRKLSGAFLLCERLASHVPVQEMYERARDRQT